jgi:hypothetical protein
MLREKKQELAEGMGFEPTIRALVPYNGLANRRLQPLGHPSAGSGGKSHGVCRDGFYRSRCRHVNETRRRPPFCAGPGARNRR